VADWSYKFCLAVALATCLASGTVGCKKKPDDTKAKAEKAETKKKPQGDRYADGVRLAAAQKEWTKRWADTTDLPACEPLLKVPTELELCKTAQAALATVKAAVAKPEPEAVLLHAAAELSFASEAASEKLRNAYMEKTQAEHKSAGPASSGAPTAKPVGSSGFARARPLGSAGKSAMADKLKGVETAPLDPDQQLMQAYARVNRASLRYLSQFLQFGPLPTRNATFTELESLSHRKELWPALGRSLREAAMTENDPTLQGKLKELAPKLSRRGPGGAGIPMMPGMPPGHPAMPEPGTPPPAPAAP
jgi:hypothetical protein